MSRALFAIGEQQFEIDEQCRWFRVDGRVVSAERWDAEYEVAERNVVAPVLLNEPLSEGIWLGPPAGESVKKAIGDLIVALETTPRAQIDPNAPMTFMTSNLNGPPTVAVVDTLGRFSSAPCIACRQCGSGAVLLTGTTLTAEGEAFSELTCDDCGATQREPTTVIDVEGV